MEEEKIVFDSPELSLNLYEIRLCRGGSYRGLHFHREAELVHVQSGSIRYIAGGDEGVLGAGDTLLLSSRICHRLLPNSEESACLFLQFDLPGGADAEGGNKFYAFLNYTKTLPFFVFDAKDSAELRQILARVEEEFRKKDVAFVHYVKAYLSLLVAFLYRKGLLLSREPILKDREILRILPAVTYINENYDKKLKLSAISENVRLDKYYFCRLFRSATGRTAVDYVNFVRLTHAAECLLKSDDPVTEISMRCGFSTLQYFNKMFRKHYGCSPTEYRHRLVRQ